MKNNSHLIKVLETIEWELKTQRTVKFHTGLCAFVFGVLRQRIITKEESNMFLVHIYDYARDKDMLSSNGELMFLWPIDDIKPRLQWLSEQIFELKKKQEELKTTGVDELENITYYDQHQRSEEVSMKIIVFISFVFVLALALYSIYKWSFE